MSPSCPRKTNGMQARREPNLLRELKREAARGDKVRTKECRPIGDLPRAGANLAAVRITSAAIGLRRSSQEHVLPGQGTASIRQPSHWRLRESRDADLI